MDDRNLTLLTAEQALNLGVIKKYGAAAATTDLGLLTDGLVRDDEYIYEDRSLKGRTGFFWTKSKSEFDGRVWGDKNMIHDIFANGFLGASPQYWRCRTIRPVLESPSVYSELYPHRVKGYNGCEEVEYGEYPQDAVPYRVQIKLEKEFAKNGMKKTGRSYTFDKEYLENGDGKFSPITYDEYEYQGQKYIRAKVYAYDDDTLCRKFSNCCSYRTGDYVWIEVSPVKWLIDEETKLLISKRGLVSGIRMGEKDTDYDFNKSDVKKYLDNYMMKDLFQSEIYTYTQLDLMAEKKEVEEKQEEIKKEQIEKLMLAKQKLKEVAELLNSPQLSLKIDKIKIDNLRNIIFKNNGEFTEKGYIEFDDFFKDNMILRLIDLSDLDLSDVNITNMNFSGTNIHIDPQTIYNKDMTGVNATDVHFSPFLDKFDDVILDGAIINSSEIMIDVDKLKSYDENTLIKGEKISNQINK